MEPRHIFLRLLLEELNLPWNDVLILNTFKDLEEKDVFDFGVFWMVLEDGWFSMPIYSDLMYLYNERENEAYKAYSLVPELKESILDYRTNHVH